MSEIYINVYGYTFHFFPPCFQRETIFFDFLFPVCLHGGQRLPKWGQLIKERICSDGSKFFPF